MNKEEELKLFVMLEKLRFNLQDLAKEVDDIGCFALINHIHINVKCGCGWEGCVICYRGYCPECHHYLKKLEELQFLADYGSKAK